MCGKLACLSEGGCPAPQALHRLARLTYVSLKKVHNKHSVAAEQSMYVRLLTTKIEVGLRQQETRFARKRSIEKTYCA